MRKLLCYVLAIIMCFSAFAAPASAASVGEELTFTAGSEEEKKSGSSQKDHRTESQKEADGINSDNHKSITKKSKELIEVIKENQIPIYMKGEDTITLVWKDGVPKEKLEWISNEGSDYKPGTNHHTGRWDDGWQKNPLGPELDILLNEVIPGHQGVRPNGGYFEWITTEDDDDKKELGSFVSSFENQGSYDVVITPGEEYIVDFDTFMTRYEMLETYLNEFVGESKTVDVNYVVQYSIRSTVKDKVKASTPQFWPGTNLTHFWEIECVDAPDDGYTRAPFSTFANEELKQTFYYAGDYHVTATQMLKNSYTDAFTWNVCEYLVIEETGQVIWKNEIEGAWIDTRRGADPLSEQRLWNVKYYNPSATAEYVYVTQYDKLWEITNNMIVGGDLPANTWGDDYTTIRVE